MQSRIGTGLVVLAGALIIGAGLGWWLTRHDAVPKIELPPATQATPAQAAKPQVLTQQVAAATAPDKAAPENTNQMIQEWEVKLDQVLVSDADEASKAASILALMPLASEEGKVTLAQHLVNMVQDDNYAATAEILTNASTPSAVSTVLMNDLLNRNNNLKLNMLLAVARTGEHPLKTEAKDILSLFIQEDKGDNWDEWEAAVNQWLQDNPQ